MTMTLERDGLVQGGGLAGQRGCSYGCVNISGEIEKGKEKEIGIEIGIRIGIEIQMGLCL